MTAHEGAWPAQRWISGAKLPSFPHHILVGNMGSMAEYEESGRPIDRSRRHTPQISTSRSRVNFVEYVGYGRPIELAPARGPPADPTPGVGGRAAPGAPPAVAASHPWTQPLREGGATE